MALSHGVHAKISLSQSFSFGRDGTEYKLGIIVIFFMGILGLTKRPSVYDLMKQRQTTVNGQSENLVIDS